MLLGKKKINSTGVLHVSGRGEVEVKPDIATVRLVVASEASTAQEAAAQNAELADNVISRIQEMNIRKEFIRTTGLRLDPIYRYDEESGQRSIVGYRAENAIAVTTSIKRAGQVFDTGIAAGASESSGLSFGLRDESRYREMALEAAIGAAHREATVVTSALRRELLDASEIVVEDQGGPVLLRADARAERSKMTTPVMPGTLTVSAQVRVTYHYR